MSEILIGTDILQGSHSFIDLVMNRYVVVAVYARAGLEQGEWPGVTVSDTSFTQAVLSRITWIISSGYSFTQGKKEEKQEDKDEVLVFIVQEYLCLMLVSFMLDVHC